MALAKIEQAIHNSQRTCVDYSQPIQCIILPTTNLPIGVLWQSQGVIEWLYLSHSPARVITPYHNMVKKINSHGTFSYCTTVRTRTIPYYCPIYQGTKGLVMAH
jgi:hypothetical protein